MQARKTAKQQLFYNTIIGTLFVAIIGTLFHFVYEWSNQNFLVGLIAPVSESTWEHIKLLFFPMLFYSIYEIIRLRFTFSCLASANALGILLGSLSIPILFYTYSGILGTNYLVLDIATFFISVIIAFTCSYLFTKNCKLKSYTKLLWIFVILLALCFFIFTYFPPKIGLFQAPHL